MGVPEINYWTAMVALFLGVPMAGIVLAVGLFLQAVIRGKRGRVSRGRDHLVVDYERALFGDGDRAA